jgi:hypothetical protein
LLAGAFAAGVGDVVGLGEAAGADAAAPLVLCAVVVAEPLLDPPQPATTSPTTTAKGAAARVSRRLVGE